MFTVLHSALAAWCCVIACLGKVSGSELKCDGDFKSLEAGATCKTTWSKLNKGSHQLRPTQPSVGWAWVISQMQLHFKSAKEAKKWFKTHQFPVVLGSEHFYLTDRHHHGAAIELTGDKHIWELDITLYVQCDLRKIAPEDFWSEMSKRKYTLLMGRPRSSPYALPAAVSPSSLPADWALTSFTDDMWRSLAGFASHVDESDKRCYRKPCVEFLDFEWSYTFNYATEVDTSFWGVANGTAFKQKFETIAYEPQPKDVDVDEWQRLGHAVLPLCHNTRLKTLHLPDAYPSQVLQGWSAVPVPDDPECPYEKCPALSSSVLLSV